MHCFRSPSSLAPRVLVSRLLLGIRTGYHQRGYNVSGSRLGFGPRSLNGCCEAFRKCISRNHDLGVPVANSWSLCPRRLVWMVQSWCLRAGPASTGVRLQGSTNPVLAFSCHKPLAGAGALTRGRRSSCCSSGSRSDGWSRGCESKTNGGGSCVSGWCHLQADPGQCHCGRACRH